jgi:hypothetical protein
MTRVRKSLGKVLAGVRAGKQAVAAALEGKPASELKSVGDVTGRTVYGDKPLRFRTLTVSDPDLPSITDPAELEAAFKIRVSQMQHARPPRDAHRLVEEQYGRRGYQLPQAKRDPNLMTFVAYDEGHIVGTVSVRIDARRRRLAADDLYPEELAALRREGRRICEFTRLAVDTAIASKPVLGSLFHTACMYASALRQRDYMVIEVNPRHAEFYARALNFHKIGPERMNLTVQAPAVLLGITFETIAARVAVCAGRSKAPEARGSLYRYFFTPQEQAGILKRLTRLVETGSDIAVSKERER